MAIRDYRDLLAWQKSLDFTEEIYRLTGAFPREERFGITAQLRRAAISISANIAEGSSRDTTRDLLSFLCYARGSTKEAESLVLVSRRLALASEADCARALELAEEVARVVSGLKASVARKNRRPSRR